MNKKIISYILLVFVALFGFNCKVDAAQELTCVYKGGWFGNSADAAMFTQDSDGKIILYKNTEEDDSDYDSINWVTMTGMTLYSDSSLFTRTNYTLSDNNAVFGGFSGCPGYSRKEGNNIYFYDDDNSKYWTWGANRELLYSYNELKIAASSTKIVDSEEYNIINSCDIEILKKSWLVGNDKILANNYTNSCLYYATDTVSFGSFVVDFSDFSAKCALIQLEFTLTDTRLSGVAILIDGTQRSLKQINSSFTSGISAYEISRSYSNGMCPVNLYVSPSGFYLTESGFLESRAKYSRIRALKEVDIGTLIDNKCDDEEYAVEHEEECKVTCEKLLSEEVVGYLNYAITAVKIAVPLILIALGVVDFAKGVFSSEEDMKKIQQKFIKRVILAVAFFLIPTVLGILLDIAGAAFGINTDFCGLTL